MAVRQPGEGIHVWQRSIVDDSGNVLPEAQVEVVNVNDPENPVAAVLYEDIDGEVELSNPFQADSDGFARFYADSGVYRITATKGAFTRTWEDVELGVMFDSLPDMTDVLTDIVEKVLEELVPEEPTVNVVVANFTVSGNGVADAGLPDGWSTSRLSQGNYEVDFGGPLPFNYVVQLTVWDAQVSDRVRSAMIVTKTLSRFTYRVRSIHDRADSGLDSAVEVTVLRRNIPEAGE